jgi:uncharacterized protein (UPF0548 family)
VKLYIISVTDPASGFAVEHVVESDNRGINTGMIPGHVSTFAESLGLSVFHGDPVTVDIGTFTPALLTKGGVKRHAVAHWLARFELANMGGVTVRRPL